METEGVLDPDNERHIFCLHVVYQPIINDMLQKFSNAWLNHKMRTVSNKSPLQMFIMGMQQIQHENRTIANEYFENLSEVQRTTVKIIVSVYCARKAKMLIKSPCIIIYFAFVE